MNDPTLPAWGTRREVQPSLATWMSPSSTSEAPASVRVVTTKSSIMPRSLTPGPMPSVRPSRLPSARPSTVEAVLAEVEIAALRAPALDTVSLELAARAAELREVVENAAEAVREARRQALESCEDSLVRLATVIARRIVGRELQTHPSLVREWIREGIASLGAEDRVDVRVSKEIAAHIGTIDCEIAGRVETDLVVDATLEGTQIAIVGRYGHVDAGFEARFAAVKAALGCGEGK